MLNILPLFSIQLVLGTFMQWQPNNKMWFNDGVLFDEIN